MNEDHCGTNHPSRLRWSCRVLPDDPCQQTRHNRQGEPAQAEQPLEASSSRLECFSVQEVRRV